jgi:SAM-dependent methyltransferase
MENTMFNRLLTPLRLLLAQREPAVPTAGDGDIIPPAEGEKAATYASGDADRYRDYQMETALPHIGESLFDVGAGTGDLAARIASRLGSRLDRLVLSHMHPNEVLRLRECFADDQAEVLDLTLPSEVEIARPVDTVLLVNVLGHIRNDVQAIEDLAKVTVPDGRLIIWEAGYSALYSEFDRRAGRVRRYNPASLAKSLRNVGLEIEVCRPINIPGWDLLPAHGRPHDRLRRPSARQALRPPGHPCDQAVRPPASPLRAERVLRGAGSRSQGAGVTVRAPRAART